MCPLYPFHVVLLYLCLLLPLLFAIVEGTDELAGLNLKSWNMSFTPEKVEKLQEFNSTQVQFDCHGCHLPEGYDPGSLQVAVINERPDLATIQHEYKESYKNDETIVLNLKDVGFEPGTADWTVMFNITGKFLGFSEIVVESWAKSDEDEVSVVARKSLPVSIVRKKTIQSKLFTYSVIILISLAYINMGCALDLNVVKDTLKKPIGPAIGFVCQYLTMPLLAFALGFLFGSKETAMRLGLFVTGCSPGGGASNIWTIMLGGNLDLSVTMTAVSTFSAFFMMPLWIFTLGSTIFDDGKIIIPYSKICTHAVFLVVPLAIGVLISRYAPKISNFLVKILKPMSLFMILFIVIFGILSNLYIFKIMTWQVFITGMCLPWIGFGLGFALAIVFRRNMTDALTIAIETGIQNTGVSIFILWYTMDHPLGDLSAVIPMAAATMTPWPLLATLIYMKVKSCIDNKNESNFDQVDADTDELKAGNFKESVSKAKLLAGNDSNGNLA